MRHKTEWLVAAGLVALAACDDGVTPADLDAGDAELSVDAEPPDAALDAAVPADAAPLDPGETEPGGALTVRTDAEGAFAREAPVLGILRRGDFVAGRQFFQLAWIPAPGRPEVDGLGPTFNATACVDCHPDNGRGGPGTPRRPEPGVLLRLGGAAGPDPVYGGQLQPFGIAGVPGEARPLRQRTPAEVVTLRGGAQITLHRVDYALDQLAFGPLAEATRVSPRLGQQLVGQGLLEAIPGERLAALADPDDRDGDGISGRIARLPDGQIGRFGWKAGQPTVEAQTAAAFAGDLGLTSPLFPTENCPPAQAACARAPHGGTPELPAVRLRVTAAYLSLLGVPARRDAAAELPGKAVFHRVGCAGCHQPDHHTGPGVLPELADQHIWPYTDLLLHDLGPGLDDGVPEGGAEPQEWRTAPLWGLGLTERPGAQRHLLHDGRAHSLAEAILWHGGEAEAARDAYAELEPADRAALHRFIESL